MRVKVPEEVRNKMERCGLSYEISDNSVATFREGAITKLVVAYVENTATYVFLTECEEDTIFIALFEERSLIELNEMFDIHVGWIVHEDEAEEVEPVILISEAELY